MGATMEHFAMRSWAVLHTAFRRKAHRRRSRRIFLQRRAETNSSFEGARNSSATPRSRWAYHNWPARPLLLEESLLHVLAGFRFVKGGPSGGVFSLLSFFSSRARAKGVRVSGAGMFAIARL